jgi:hypothetical protein
MKKKGKDSKMSHGQIFKRKILASTTHTKEVLLCDPGIAHRQPLLTVAS